MRGEWHWDLLYELTPVEVFSMPCPSCGQLHCVLLNFGEQRCSRCGAMMVEIVGRI